jgi:uncharacterized protein YjbJ (UPF0337 family)
MSTDGRTNQIKGRVKEAAGVLTGDRKLQLEGQLDRAAGNVEETLRSVEENLRRIVDRLKRAAGR